MLLKIAAGSAAAVLAIGGLAACSSSSSSEATSASPSESAASMSPSPTGESIVALDKQIQTDLNAVGCYAGAVDGILGPETDQAIVKFQTADGLTVDGEAGPATVVALKKAAKEGRIVCTATTSPTATPTSPTASPTSAGGACTATALQASLPSGAQLQSFTCANVGGTRWAAGQYMSGPEVANFFAKSEGGSWTSVSSDEICGTASAGLPQKLLDYCGLT